jgi:hypothetical protein
LSLSHQSWDQYLGEIFGTQGPEDDFNHTFTIENLGLLPDPLESTSNQTQTEQWGVEDTGFVHESVDEFLPEEDQICYGMVSYSSANKIQRTYVPKMYFSLLLCRFTEHLSNSVVTWQNSITD